MKPLPSWFSFVGYALLPVAAMLGVSCASGSVGGPSPAPAADSAVVQLDPEAFRDAVAAAEAFIVNVHVPYEGEIPGTDSFIPFDAIEQRAAELPRAKDAPLYIYCRSGRMSAAAIPALQRLGHTNIIELKGGMDAWRQAGFTIEGRTP